MKRAIAGLLIVGMMAGMTGCQTGTTEVTTAGTTTAAATTEATTTATTQTGIAIDEIEAIFTQDEYPRVDGSTVTIPLSEKLYSVACGVDEETARLNILHNTTHAAYENLIAGDADIIFVTYPSAEEQQMAKDAGIECAHTGGKTDERFCTGTAHY